MTSKAAIIGLESCDAEVLHLLLDVLGWKSVIISDDLGAGCIGAQLVFVGRKQAQAALELIKIDKSKRCVLVANLDCVDQDYIDQERFYKFLFSPIEIQAAENLINSVSVELSINE